MNNHLKTIADDVVTTLSIDEHTQLIRSRDPLRDIVAFAHKLGNYIERTLLISNDPFDVGKAIARQFKINGELVYTEEDTKYSYEHEEKAGSYPSLLRLLEAFDFYEIDEEDLEDYLVLHCIDIIYWSHEFLILK